MAPWGVINAAGWVRVDAAESCPADCMAANAHGAERLAKACQARDLPLVTFSSDLVFDGELDRRYVEADLPRPLNVYGASKALAERRILKLGGRFLIVRTAAFFSPYDPHNFAAHVLRTLATGQSLPAADDLTVSPTYVPDLVDAVLDLFIDGETGLRHLVNDGAVTWADFARRIARALDLDPGLVDGVSAARFGWAARRPASAALATCRGEVMASLDDAIARYAAIIRNSDFVAEARAPLGDLGSQRLTINPRR
jgi:dTDP-4-dehydrorhamnose reductase